MYDMSQMCHHNQNNNDKTAQQCYYCYFYLSLQFVLHGWCVAFPRSQLLTRTLTVFDICWPDQISPNQQQEEKVWMWME